MIKALKWLGIIVGSIILISLVAGLIAHESKPKGIASPKADLLAERMLQAVDKPAWDSTKFVKWTFKGVHSFLWDKERHLSKVTWGETEVLLDINNISGKAWNAGAEITGEDAKTAVRTAWEYFCNDSFWLNAVTKVFDPGTERSIVKMDNGSDALMVTYTSGGVTPGDSYLWILDENARPTSWKMWVNIIPIGGLEWTWEDWTKLPTGAEIATLHQHPILNIDISNLMATQNIKELGYDEDPFAEIVK